MAGGERTCVVQSPQTDVRLDQQRRDTERLTSCSHAAVHSKPSETSSETPSEPPSQSAEGTSTAGVPSEVNAGIGGPDAQVHGSGGGIMAGIAYTLLAIGGGLLAASGVALRVRRGRHMI